MTKFVIELHYDDGTRQLLGPFDNAAAAAERGELLLAVRDRITAARLNAAGYSLAKYRVVPLGSP